MLDLLSLAEAMHGAGHNGGDCHSQCAVGCALVRSTFVCVELHAELSDKGSPNGTIREGETHEGEPLAAL